ncbi:MAG: T9SS type A sorting domain-containing protein, partial [Bacteroidota bacterium]|nr:T9SS type A sorting domain-containing protein [Bacteroidota bacterium]
LDKKGNMASSIDFRAVYASVLTDWLCADEVDVSNTIIGPKPDILGLGLGCDGSEKLNRTDDPLLPLHAAVSQDQGVSLYLTLNQSSKVEINVFDVLGRKVGNTISSDLNSGNHNLSLIDAAARRLPPGQYFYKITTNGEKTYSKSFLVR